MRVASIWPGKTQQHTRQEPRLSAHPARCPGSAVCGNAGGATAPRRDAVHRLYAAVVEQSRQPTFYADWGVPDSREGRLEMLNLHAMLLMRRLRSEGHEGRAVAQALFDLDVPRSRPPIARVGRGRPVGRQACQEAGAELLRPRRSAGSATDSSRRRGYRGCPAPQVYSDGRPRRNPPCPGLAEYLLRQETWLEGSDGSAIVDGLVTFARPVMHNADRRRSLPACAGATLTG